VYVETGAWYDGWETRRHNPSPPDFVNLRLGPFAGRVRGVEIDTAFFDGNHAESVEVLGAFETGPDADEVVLKSDYKGWRVLLSKRPCGPSLRHAWMVDGGVKVTHTRLNMYPDGGIARFRLYGAAIPVWAEGEVELSAATNGGVVTGCSDEHFGKAGNVLLPGRGKDMGDGWETKRSRASGHEDWVIVRLAARGRVERVVVDTMHFRGNFPRGVRIEGLDAGEETEVGVGDKRWRALGKEVACERDKEHGIEVERVICTHAKIVILPDGGVKRFRVFGTRV